METDLKESKSREFSGHILCEPCVKILNYLHSS